MTIPPEHATPGTRVPTQRPGLQPPTPRLDDAAPATTVLPCAVSALGSRTRRLRAWMITAPVDLLTLLAPLLWTVRYWRGTLAFAALTLVLFAAGGLYRARRHVSILDELPTLVGRLLAGAAAVAIIAALRHESVSYVSGFLRLVALGAGLVLVGRVVTRFAVVLARRHRWVEHTTLIVGSGPIAVELDRLLRRNPRYGLRCAGHVDATARAGGPPLVGDLDSLEESIRLVDCEVLVVADPDCPEPALTELLRRPAAAACDLWAVPRLGGSPAPAAFADHIGAIPVVHVRHTTLSDPRWRVKRASDIAFALVGLVVLSPVMLICAVAVLLEGGRGVLFRQERVGHLGRPIEVIKFRTVKPLGPGEAETAWSINGDRRIGPVGRFLRRTSLDELPQLWNILRGDMTLVGPRPERPYFVKTFSAEHPEYARRHRVPVGLTGLAQVSGLRGDVPISDRARYDNYYIENWSLWLDAKVLLRTVAEVLRGSGR